MRAATVSPELAGLLARRGSRSLTIAIESGSDRIRQLVNKKLSAEEITAAAVHARQGGLSGLKLYGMVGLPSETDDDVEATASLLLRLRKAVPGLRLATDCTPRRAGPADHRPSGLRRLLRIGRKA